MVAPAAVASFGEVYQSLALAGEVAVVVHAEEVAVAVERHLKRVAKSAGEDFQIAPVRITADNRAGVWIDPMPAFFGRDVDQLQSEYGFVDDKANRLVSAGKCMAPRKFILIADDEDFLVQMVKHSLEKAGFGVLVASNGQAAYEAATEHRPDLVISDYQMPVLDGLGLCVRLKANPTTKEIPVLMLTARGHVLGPSELARTNVRAVIAKPFSVRRLVAWIEETLNGTDIERRKVV